MTRFFIKCSFLIALLFVGVLIGMKKANEGMVYMKGYNDPTLQSPVKIHGKSVGNIESSVSGENRTSHNLDEKKNIYKILKPLIYFLL